MLPPHSSAQNRLRPPPSTIKLPPNVLPPAPTLNASAQQWDSIASAQHCITNVSATLRFSSAAHDAHHNSFNSASDLLIHVSVHTSASACHFSSYEWKHRSLSTTLSAAIRLCQVDMPAVAVRGHSRLLVSRVLWCHSARSRGQLALEYLHRTGSTGRLPKQSITSPPLPALMGNLRWRNMCLVKTEWGEIRRDLGNVKPIRL